MLVRWQETGPMTIAEVKAVVAEAREPEALNVPQASSAACGTTI